MSIGNTHGVKGDKFEEFGLTPVQGRSITAAMGVHDLGPQPQLSTTLQISELVALTTKDHV